jgi:hypothetical protein
VAELGEQAAQALDHAHQAGIVHRDVKPGNLLLDGSGRLWVTDFGLAHVQHGEASLTMTGDLVGTLRYMSPEQALAKRVPIDHRTDVYSLGATLYELLTLRPAFQGSDRQELLRQIAFEEPPPPRRLDKAVPVELETIVLKALEKNPVERYATAQELADDLQRFLDHKPIRARRTGVVQRVRKWYRRHPAAVATAVALLILMLVASAAVFWWEDRQSQASLAALRVEQEKTAAALEKEHRTSYLQGILLADREREANNMERSEELLANCPADRRGWEWHYLNRLHRGYLTSHKLWDKSRSGLAALSPDGQRLAILSGKGMIWDVATGRQLVSLQTGDETYLKVKFDSSGTRLVGWKAINEWEEHIKHEATLAVNAWSLLTQAQSRQLTANGLAPYLLGAAELAAMEPANRWASELKI